MQEVWKLNTGIYAKIVFVLVVLTFCLAVGGILMIDTAAAQETTPTNNTTQENNTTDDLPPGIVKDLGNGVIVRDVIETDTQYKVVVENTQTAPVDLVKGYAIEPPWIVEKDEVTIAKGNHTIIFAKKPNAEAIALVNPEAQKYHELKGQWELIDDRADGGVLLAIGLFVASVTAVAGAKYSQVKERYVEQRTR